MNKIETMKKISCQNISAKSGPSDADSRFKLDDMKLTVVVFISGVSNSVKTFSKGHQMIHFVQNSKCQKLFGRRCYIFHPTVSNRKI